MTRALLARRNYHRICGGKMLVNKSKEEFLKLRRARIALLYQNLNEMQREAVMTTEGPLLVLAGAGSGKTTVLISRIANLIRFGAAADSEEIPDYITDEDCELIEKYIKAPSLDIEDRVDQLCALRPAAPWSIIAITFTNKAADELKERLSRTIGEERAKDVWAQTFHSACVRILRGNIEKLGFDKSFTIYDADDSARVMKEIIRGEGLDDKMFAPKAVLGMIGRDAKDKVLSPDEYEKALERDNKFDFYSVKLAKLYKKYQARLKAANALDFDDIIMHTVTLLRNFPEVREYYRNKFKYVLIDEYQDTSHAQDELARLLTGEKENICVVGDDDQSIYSFRGAVVDNILGFDKKYENTKIIRLEQNYRSTQRILDIANEGIKHNRDRKEKTLYTKNEGGSTPVVIKLQNDFEEGRFIADKILSEVAKGATLSDFAVLYRTRGQSVRIQQALARAGIGCKTVGEHDFYSRAEVKDMTSYLWVIHNPSDAVRLKRIINTPARKIGEKLVETLENVAAVNNASIYDVMKNAESYPELSRSKAAISNFVDIIESLRAKVSTMPLNEFFDCVCEETGYVSALIEKNDEQSKTRLENISELKSVIERYESMTEEPSLNGFLDEISLYTDRDEDSGKDVVLLMTIHTAKGLEFNTVFLAGVEEGLFPSERSFTDREIEEERRIFYVAVTRAKHNLYISHVHERMIFGQTKYQRPSRFIKEIPTEKYDEKNEAQKQHHFTDDAPFEAVSRVSRPAPRAKMPSFTPKPQVAGLSFKSGDKINHKAFGDGIIVSSTPMGGDALLEIKFDNVGTKRLMQKTAGQFIKKL